jgi:hypothetical protein
VIEIADGEIKEIRNYHKRVTGPSQTPLKPATPCANLLISFGGFATRRLDLVIKLVRR